MVKGRRMREIPLAPISPRTVNRCAISAHILPLTTTRSQVDICPSLAANLASLSLATFCWGVSPVGFDGLEWLGFIGGPLREVGMVGFEGEERVGGLE